MNNKDKKDIRVLVAIDFGTTYSGFAYVHKESRDRVVVNVSWPGQVGREGDQKVPTALQYDEEYKKVIGWGKSALEEEPDEISDDPEEKRPRPVEKFKLHISDLKNKPWLPSELDYKKAIEDYLTQMSKTIKNTLENKYPTVIFPDQVEFMLTIPAEWPPHTVRIMRECAYKAGLLTSLGSDQLDFVTEPEAAAVHCLSFVKEQDLQPSDLFLVVDCGGGTVDLTSRKLLLGSQLSEITERVGDLCGSTFVDEEFLKWIERKVSSQAFEELKSNHYGQVQHLVQRFFCTRIKFKFTGDPGGFKTLKLNLAQYCPNLPDYVKEETTKEQMNKLGWVLKIDFESVRNIFDEVVNRIIRLINDQLKKIKEVSNKECSAIFMVGGFSGSPYLLCRVKETFKHTVRIIVEPTLPIEAVVRGAVAYGLNPDIVRDRILKWTYGIKTCRKWVEGDETTRETPNGMIFYFHKLESAQRGENVEVNKQFWGKFSPLNSNQAVASFEIYYTSRYNEDAKFCDEPGVKLLGTLKVMINGTQNSNSVIEFSLTFGKMEIKATAKNKNTGDPYEGTFEYDNNFLITSN